MRSRRPHPGIGGESARLNRARASARTPDTVRDVIHLRRRGRIRSADAVETAGPDKKRETSGSRTPPAPCRSPKPLGTPANSVPKEGDLAPLFRGRSQPPAMLEVTGCVVVRVQHFQQRDRRSMFEFFDMKAGTVTDGPDVSSCRAGVCRRHARDVHLNERGVAGERRHGRRGHVGGGESRARGPCSRLPAAPFSPCKASGRSVSILFPRLPPRVRQEMRHPRRDHVPVIG